MHLFVFGSLAYDRIMTFGGRFADHILPEKIHMMNVCFTVNGLRENLGGTAGNIAYGLTLLNERPSILGCFGKDGGRYMDYLRDHGVDTSHIRVVEEEFTAGAYITTDMDNNQITGFNPGVMNHPCGFSLEGIDPKDSLAIIAPAGLEDMRGLPEMFRKAGLRFIFDPGQQLNVLTGQSLLDALQGAEILISNDYEHEMIIRSTGASHEDLMGMVENIITTKGEDGSMVYQKGATYEIPIAPADKVVDPTGAGDSFRSGLMKGLSMGKDVVEASYYGAALASFSVAHHGTQEYSVTEEQFEERLAKVRALAG